MLYDFTARMHEDDIVYIHQRAQRAGIALKTKYSPLVDIYIYDRALYIVRLRNLIGKLESTLGTLNTYTMFPPSTPLVETFAKPGVFSFSNLKYRPCQS